MHTLHSPLQHNAYHTMKLTTRHTHRVTQHLGMFTEVLRTLLPDERKTDVEADAYDARGKWCVCMCLWLYINIYVCCVLVEQCV
jgi:hypothetical protein